MRNCTQCKVLAIVTSVDIAQKAQGVSFSSACVGVSSNESMTTPQLCQARIGCPVANCVIAVAALSLQNITPVNPMANSVKIRNASDISMN